MKKTIALLAVLLAALSTPAVEVKESLWTQNEFSLGLFSTFSTLQEHIGDSWSENGDYGVGVEANWFFHRNAGLSFDSVIADVSDIQGECFDHSSLSLVVRFPYKRVSPYVLAGGGRDWERSIWDTHVGVGAEVAVTESWSWVSETRWTFATQKQDDFLQFRTGLRFKF